MRGAVRKLPQVVARRPHRSEDARSDAQGHVQPDVTPRFRPTIKFIELYHKLDITHLPSLGVSSLTLGQTNIQVCPVFYCSLIAIGVRWWLLVDTPYTRFGLNAHIPRSGGLEVYCTAKMVRTMMQIVALNCCECIAKHTRDLV